MCHQLPTHVHVYEKIKLTYMNLLELTENQLCDGTSMTIHDIGKHHNYMYIYVKYTYTVSNKYIRTLASS